MEVGHDRKINNILNVWLHYRWQLNCRPSYKVSVANVDHNSCRNFRTCTRYKCSNRASVSTTVNVTSKRSNYKQLHMTTKVDKQCTTFLILQFWKYQYDLPSQIYNYCKIVTQHAINFQFDWMHPEGINPFPTTKRITFCSAALNPIIYSFPSFFSAMPCCLHCSSWMLPRRAKLSPESRRRRPDKIMT